MLNDILDFTLGVEAIPIKKKEVKKSPRQYSPTRCLFKRTQSSNI